MSAVHSGVVEPIPFILGQKIYVDADQFEDLSSSRSSLLPTTRHPALGNLLTEFYRAGIVEPIAYRSLVSQRVERLLHIAHAILLNERLPLAAAESRRLWFKYLQSPGSHFLLRRDHELSALQHRLDVRYYEGVAPAECLHGIPETTEYVPVAAIRCGHDVFDIVTMLHVGEKLDAAVCDWQMYDPLYSLALATGAFSFTGQRPASEIYSNSCWYLPIPRSFSIDDLIQIREEPTIKAIREGLMGNHLRQLSYDSAVDVWKQVRDKLQSKIKARVLLNSYNIHQRHRSGFVIDENMETYALPNRGVQANFDSLEWRATSVAQLQSTRIVFVSADPSDLTRLRLDQEYREISEKLRFSRNRASVTVAEALSARAEDLSQVLLDYSPTILHFSGHGTKDGCICLEDAVGRVSPVHPDALEALLRPFSEPLQLVVLNACYSKPQAERIAKVVPYVVGVDTAIADKAAIAYSVGLYQAIGGGMPIPQAHELGLAQILLRGISGEGVPVLLEG